MFLFSQVHTAFVTMGLYLPLLPPRLGEALGVWGTTASAVHLDGQDISSTAFFSSRAAVTRGLRESPGAEFLLSTVMKALLCLPGVGPWV